MAQRPSLSEQARREVIAFIDPAAGRHRGHRVLVSLHRRGDRRDAAHYRPFLARNPERCAAAVAAVARARPGGVVVHCGIGRDRTGLVSLLLLALAGVTADAIAADYARSAERLRPHFAEAYAAPGDVIAGRMARHGVTVHDAIRAVLADLRPADWIPGDIVRAVCERLGCAALLGSDSDGQA